MRNTVLAWLHGAAIFTAAVLLFAVQPMIGKLALPVLGGTPGVWNTCMVFYQGALLAGYAYAHGGSSWMGVRRQAAVHLVVLGAAFLALPIALSANLSPPGSGGLAPALWLFGVLTTAAGLPFFCVASTSPLLHRWFSLSGHPRAHDPYFLYAASNAGSLAAVLSYPWVIEPFISLSRQGRVWAAGFGVLAALVAACGAMATWKSRDDLSEPLNGAMSLGDGDVGPPALAHLARWAVLAAIPSSWLLGVTAYITTDLAAIPLLWTAPLAVYLLTYILAFARGSSRTTRGAAAMLPWLATPLVMVLAAGFVHLFWLPLHLLVFFAGALVCHGQLADSRPSARHATAFYLAIAAGGVAGGVFNALLAPVIFDRLVEYPMAVVLGCLASPGVSMSIAASPSGRDRLLDVILPLIVSGLTAALVASPSGFTDSVPGMLGVVLTAGLAAHACSTGRRRPVRFALVAAGVLLASSLARYSGGRLIHRERDFFGMLRVLHDPNAGVHRLLQGSTLHGQQSLDPDARGEPSTYFTRNGPIGQVFEALESRPAAEPTPRVGIVGLGAGTLACYARRGERWTFFEIDPAVPRIAANPLYFTYLADGRDRGARIDVVMGDARLRIRELSDHDFRLLVLDAFSSDAVPVHLLSREAIRLYQAKLDPHGLLAFNLSNRYLDLEPLMTAQADDAGLVCRVRDDLSMNDDERRAGKQPSIWTVMARAEGDLGGITSDPRWREPRRRPGAKPWTDDESDLASYLVLWGPRSRSRPAKP